MARHKMVSGEKVMLTKAEEDQRDAEEKLWADGAVSREAMNKIIALENAISPRRMRDSVLTDDGKTWLDDQEKLIAVERAKL